MFSNCCPRLASREADGLICLVVGGCTCWQVQDSHRDQHPSSRSWSIQDAVQVFLWDGVHVPALESLASQVEEWSSVSCRFECACHELVADNEAAIQLYRIAQEALTNAVKHGGSREMIVVALSKDARGGTLEIRDDGVGVPAEAETAEGAGLRIMHYRASVIGAMLEVRQQPGGGTLIRCTRPQG